MPARSILAALAAWLIAGTAGAAGEASPWDGSWFRDAARSRDADHSFSLTRLPDGRWRYDDGASRTEFATDGKPWPEMWAPDTSIVAHLSGDVLDQTELLSGRPTGRTVWMLSRDRRSLTGRYTRDYPDGTSAESPIYAVRMGDGADFAGTWKMLADPPPARAALPQPVPPPISPPAPARPHWIIATARDGTLTWFIPATGEMLRGRLDGHPRKLTGPQQPAGRTFLWRRISPRRIDFYCYDAGHLIERAIETLSADGATMTDTLWSTGHADERDVSVFTRR